MLDLDIKIREEADRILYKKGLYPALEKFGKVVITGSYALKCMAWRDLDIYLLNDDRPVEEFFIMGGEIASFLAPSKMNYRNEIIGKRANLPEGLYWGIYLGDERKGEWKIDIWMITEKDYEKLDEYNQSIKRLLTLEKRQKIICIKSKCWLNAEYRRRFNAVDIYKAVLSDGVVNFEEFREYLKIRDVVI